MSLGSSKLLTNGEHDVLWKNAFTVIPEIAASLRYSNAIECVKILHDAGKITDDDFHNCIAQILKAEGFNWSK